VEIVIYLEKKYAFLVLKNMILRIKIKDFDFYKTFNSGLFYFFYEEKPVRVLYYNNKFIEANFEQKENYLIVKLNKEIKNRMDLINKIRYCFGLDEDMSFFYKLCMKDKVLRKFINEIRGTRIISPFSDFESFVGAIISQNNSYKNYRRKMLEIYRKLNFVRKYYTYENLMKLKLGYKIDYLLNLAKAKNLAGKIKGIGKYSINLYKIFRLRDYSSFYIDCLIEKIFREEYGINTDIDKYSLKFWGNYRGLVGGYLQRFFEKIY